MLDGEQILGTAILDTNNNRTSEGRITPGPIATAPNRHYTLRVTNETGTNIGVYFNADPDSANLSTTISGAHSPADDGPSALDLSALVDDRGT